jgi:macrodomain Ter protein organizer (MatP/YcbG family)
MLVLKPNDKQKQEMTTLSVRLPTEDYNKLVREAEKAGLTVSEAIRQLISQLTNNS